MSFVQESKRNNYTVLTQFHRKISSVNSVNSNSQRKILGNLSPTRIINTNTIFKKDYPEIIKGQPGNVFQNLTLIMDSTEEDVCDANSTFIIAVVPTATNNFLERDFIRKSWADKELFKYTRLRTVFLLGETEVNETQHQIETEADKYRDILQMNYIDSYRNLTYKTISGLLWISENCKDIPWVLKIDDDVMINPFHLRDFLENELREDASPKKIIGRLRSRAQPFKSGKWKVTKSEYTEKNYPPFVLGSAYVIGRNAVERLINAAFRKPFFHLEDVFTTGIVAKEARISHKNIEKTHFVNNGKMLSNLYRGKLIFNVGQGLKRRKAMWQNIIKYKPK